MPRAKVSGDLLQGIKGISIRDSEGHEFRMDLTQTQPPDVPRDDAAGIKGAAAPAGVDKSAPTATAHFSSDDELHGPRVGVQGSQSLSQRRRVAVRKVPACRLSQETSSQDDFVDAPPLKKQKPDANKSTVSIGRTGLRSSMKQPNNGVNQETSSEDDFVQPAPLKKQMADCRKNTMPIHKADLRRSVNGSCSKQASSIIKDENKNKYPTIQQFGQFTVSIWSMSRLTSWTQYSGLVRRK
ncbi:unnamed protein product [Urochloa humidicola]